MRLYRRDFGPYFWDSANDRLTHLNKDCRKQLREKTYKYDLIIEWVYDNLTTDFNHTLVPLAVRLAKITTVKLFIITTYTRLGNSIQTIKAVGYSKDIRKFRTSLTFCYENLKQSKTQIARELRAWKKHTNFHDPKRGILIPHVKSLTKQFYLIEYKLYMQSLNKILAAYKKPPYKAIIHNKYQRINKYVEDKRLKDIPLTKKTYEQYRLYFQQDKGNL